MSGPGSTLLSIMMIAVFALAAGGLHVLVNRKDRKRGLLMVATAIVMMVNVLIWTL